MISSKKSKQGSGIPALDPLLLDAREDSRIMWKGLVYSQLDLSRERERDGDSKVE